mmetsp:Transcript_106/g.199  ORF Transcript_106/g.199 Transcript_106/m.199 type:complete len:428 (+) Transcript_106:612-1895(+)
MSFLDKLLYVLGGRSTSTGLEKTTAIEQRNNGKHLGRSSELQDGEQIGEVITENVSGDRDSVQATLGALTRLAHGIGRLHDRDLKSRGVMVLQVGVDLLDDVGVMGSVSIQPENSRVIGGASTAHGEADPVTNGLILGLAHAPNVSLLNIVGHQNIASGIHNTHLSGAGNFKSVGVGAVLLSLLCHETNIRDISHSSDVKLTILAAEVHDLSVGRGIASVGNEALGVFQGIILVPHHTGVTDNTRHGSIHDNITGHVKVGDSLGGINHGQPGARLVARINVSQHLSLLLGGGLLKLVVNISKAIAHIDTKRVEEGTVLLEDRLEEAGHAVTEHDGVGNLHHGGLQVQGQQNVLLLGFGNFSIEKLAEGLLAHERRVNDFSRLKRGKVLHDDSLAIRTSELNLDRVVLGHDNRLLRGVEISMAHVSNM